MDSFLWPVLSYLPLFTITSILVPFGMLLHYWRRADSAHPSPVPGQDASAIWPSAVRRQIFRGRIASGVASIG